MELQILSSSTQSKAFLLKRIGEVDLEISNEERMVILRALKANVRYVQIRDYTLMLNAIKSIDPKPREVEEYVENLELPEPMTEIEREQAIKSVEIARGIFRNKRIKGGDDDE